MKGKFKNHDSPNDQIKESVSKGEVFQLFLLLLEIASHDVKNSQNFEEDFRKRLKFQKTTDWRRYRASVDVLEDTEYAILSAFKFQLGDLKNKNNDFGEKYLRLYGILNAVYLQMNAYKEIANLINYPERDLVMKNFEKLDIYRVRNIAGAHTTDFRYDKKDLANKEFVNRSNSFRIMQIHLDKTGDKIQIVDENQQMETHSLLSILSEYEKVSTDLLIKLITHMTNTLIYKREDKAEIRERLKNMIPNLIDYSQMDKNKEFREKELEKLKQRFID